MPAEAEPVPTKEREITPSSEEFRAKTKTILDDLYDDEVKVEEEDDDEVKEKLEQTKPTKEEKVQGEEKTQEGDDEKEEETVEARVERAITEGFKKVAPETRQAEPEVKLTPAQEDELLGRFKPNDQLLEMLDSEDKQVRLNAVNTIVQGAVKQALVMSKYLVDQVRDELHGQVAPLRQDHQMSAQEKGRAEFFTQYPALKGGEGVDYTDFLVLAAEDLKKEGFKPKSNEDAAKTLATRAAERIKKFNPKFELGTPSTQKTTTKAKTTMPKQPVTSPGGSGGTASNGSTGLAGNRTSGVELYD